MQVLPPIINPVNYAVELYKKIEWSPSLSIAPNAVPGYTVNRQLNIYAFSVAPLITDPNNYWIKWGGHFDNPGNDLVILIDTFLTRVDSIALLEIGNNAYFIDKVNDLVFIIVDYKPWEYLLAKMAVFSDKETTFSSGPKPGGNPSDAVYGDKTVFAKFLVPSFSNRLSNAFAGVETYNDFQANLINVDGFFDNYDSVDYFNVPLKIKKDSFLSIDIDDFKLIRTGAVDNITTTLDQISFECKDTTYLLTNEVCKTLTLDDYPNAPDASVNQFLPVMWGSALKIPLIEIDRDLDPVKWIDYLALDKDFIIGVDNVYDTNGKLLSFTFNAINGQIRVTQLDNNNEIIEGAFADVTGKINNTLFDIVTEVLGNVESFPYAAGIWDIPESDLYSAIAPELNFYFAGGITRKFLKEVFKNDMVYLILKNNNLFTLRRWGQVYNEFSVENWLITQETTKDYTDAKDYFCSTVVVNTDRNYSGESYNTTYIDDTRENEIFAQHKKHVTANFKTELNLSLDVVDFATRILDRFGIMKETIQVGLAVDTYEVNLLDTIELEILVNGRQFSVYSTWIVKGIDPGQDTLILEGKDIYYLHSFDNKAVSFDDGVWGATEVL